MTSRYTGQHTVETDNLAAINDRKQYAFDSSLLEWEETGNFWDVIESLSLSLVVSREYEHFIVALSAKGGRPQQSVLPLPHPSGIVFDAPRGELIVSSTRTPNIVFWLRQVKPQDLMREIVPHDMVPPAGNLFLPYRSTLLPGSLYIHEIGLLDGALIATATGHNFVARLGNEGGWDRAWWPRAVDGLGLEGFRHNFLQLNGMAVGASLEQCYFTAFADSVQSSKPWKEGYGPKGKGVIFSGATRKAICGNLTCPHSVRLYGDAVWACNSGYGEIVRLGAFPSGGGLAQAEPVTQMPGFTRGLAFHGDFAFVGLSRVIEAYEPYAPGLKPAQSQCGLVIIDVTTGCSVGSLIWTNGYQVFDVQVLPGFPAVQFPYEIGAEGINHMLRYLG